MSRLFYDDLVKLEKIESIIDYTVESLEEREELWQIVDEMIHHRVVSCVLDVLDQEHHHDFLSLIHTCPYDIKIIEFINLRIDDDIEQLIEKEIRLLEEELLALL